jgi:hypothetical protein
LSTHRLGTSNVLDMLLDPPDLNWLIISSLINVTCC